MRALISLLVLALAGVAAFFWLQGADPMPVPSGSGPASSGTAGSESPAGSGAPSEPAQPVAPAQGGGATDRQSVGSQALLAGRLLQDDEPLAFVTVIACKGSPSAAEELARTVTAADGTFRFERTGSRFWLTADGDRVPHHWKSRWVSPRDGIGEVHVPRPGSIAGVVRDEAGAPLRGVEVTRVISHYRSVHVGARSELSTRTDASGRFRFDRVAKDQGTLRCRAEGYQLVPEHDVDIDIGEDATTEIVMRPGMTLRGIVMDHVGHALQGAVVATEDGQRAVTDTLGAFVIEDFRRYAEIDITAKGHLPHKIKWLFDTKQLQRVKLERAATLRGVVKGSEGRPGSVYVERSDRQGADASDTPCYDVLFEKLDIVRDGRFELPGFALADFDVTIRIPGVGVCGPQRVELRGDREVEFEIVPQRVIPVTIRNREGKIVESVRLVRDDGCNEYPERYLAKGAKLLAQVRKSYHKRKPVTVDGGTFDLGVPVGEGFAFYLEAEGYLRVAAAAPFDDLPERIDLVLSRAGGVTGVVHGGLEGAYARYVSIVPLDESGNEVLEPQRGGKVAKRKTVASANINQRGEFTADGLAPGRYRANVARVNRRTIEKDTRGTPLVDASHDTRTGADFVVRPGERTRIELHEPRLGRCIGRVLLRGVPVEGAIVVASRPDPAKASPSEAGGEAAQVRFGSVWGQDDFDDPLHLGYMAGQRTGADGSFAFLYRDAGAVEIRVRHEEGLTTSRALVVQLPPPGADVTRDVALPSGEIRGSYPFDSLDEDQRKSFTVTLFPPNKTLHDPFYHPDHGGSIAWDCPHVEKSTDGSFRFPYLRAGRWLVRVHHSGDVVLWQKVVDVHRDVVDLGELPAVARVKANVQWTFVGKKPGNVIGLWVRAPQGEGRSPIWVATCKADHERDRATLELMPGKYELTAFGWFSGEGFEEDIFDMLSIGLTGQPFSRPHAIEVRPDGTVTPQQVAFELRPPDKK